MKPVDPITLERAPVRLVPLALEHEEGLARAAVSTDRRAAVIDIARSPAGHSVANWN
ncbi:MAG: hypothetical protein U1F49_19180 [Rubrivivax sp.]